MKWIIALVALVVCCAPIDFIPDVLPFGSLDDIAFALGAVQAFKKAAEKRLGIVQGQAVERLAA